MTETAAQHEKVGKARAGYISDTGYFAAALRYEDKLIRLGKQH
jgi:hypothetical protein